MAATLCYRHGRVALTGLLHWVLVLAVTCPALAMSATENIAIGYLELLQQRPPLLSNVLPEPEDSGLQGARLAISDNNSAGRFLGQQYQLLEARSENLEALIEQAEHWYQQDVHYLVVRLPAKELRRLAGHFSGRPLLIFNAAAADDDLRQHSCLNNVLHTAPSRAMLTDALAQWLIAKRLKRWLLIEGQRTDDSAYADALRRAAKRFGATIVAEKRWSFDSDLRRTAQAELPLFTQTKEYDVVVIADELGDFGEYVLYNTWYPRPVVGTQGLKPVAWHRVVEQWGAAQLQSRFEKQAQRWMNDADYGSWLAVRAVGEGVSQLADTDAGRMTSFLLSEGFQLGGFKGRKLSFRPWNGQLRQPIPLIHPRALVSQSPQEGYLHPHTDLDTLGYDRPESRCRISEQLDLTETRNDS